MTLSPVYDPVLPPARRQALAQVSSPGPNEWILQGKNPNCK